MVKLHECVRFWLDPLFLHRRALLVCFRHFFKVEERDRQRLCARIDAVRLLRAWWLVLAQTTGGRDECRLLFTACSVQHVHSLSEHARVRQIRMESRLRCAPSQMGTAMAAGLAASGPSRRGPFSRASLQHTSFLLRPLVAAPRGAMLLRYAR